MHGAVSDDSEENRLKLAENLKNSRFYTLQVKWGAEIEQKDGTVHVLPSFYAIYDSGKCLIKQAFQNTLIGKEIRAAFFLGGFVFRTDNTLNNLDTPANNSSQGQFQTGQIKLLYGGCVQH